MQPGDKPMKHTRAIRPLSLLLCLCLLLPFGSGCATWEAYRYFLTGSGTKDPAAGAVTSPTPEGADLALSYDENATLSGRFVALVDVQTSDPALLSVEVGGDEAAPTFSLRACGTGSAILVYEQNGVEQRLTVRVSPARLAVFFLLGERDARGSSEAESGLLRASDGMVYYTFPEDARSRLTPDSVYDYLPESLTENQMTLSGYQLYYTTNELTDAGRGRRAAIAAPLAYKWAEQTGEHVWVINLAKEGLSITDLLLGAGGEADNLAALAEAAFSLLTEEYEAGHYTHARTGWFLLQGETDCNMPAADYLAALEQLSVFLDDTLAFSYKNFGYSVSFGGLLGCRAFRTGGEELSRISGPRAAQLTAAGMGGALSRVYLLSDTAGLFYNDQSVAAHFAQYDPYKFKLYYGYDLPTTTAELYTAAGDLRPAACNELAALAVENLLVMAGLRQGGDVTPTLTLLAYDGQKAVGDMLSLSYGGSTVAAAPRVEPLWAAKAAGYTVKLEAEGRTSDLCRLTDCRGGETVRLVCTGADGKTEERQLPVRRTTTYAFSAYPTILTKNENGYDAFLRFSAPFSCGYIDKESGAFTPYVKLDWRTGWLYDGKSIWNSHGGVQVTNNYSVGPLAGVDSGYAFTSPVSGMATVAFAYVQPGKNDYLLAVCVNGKPVWPRAADDPRGDENFYTVKTSTTVEELNAAIAALSFAVQEGDVVTFTYRRIAAGLTAEGAAWPIITIG